MLSIHLKIYYFKYVVTGTFKACFYVFSYFSANHIISCFFPRRRCQMIASLGRRSSLEVSILLSLRLLPRSNTPLCTHTVPRCAQGRRDVLVPLLRTAVSSRVTVPCWMSHVLRFVCAWNQHGSVQQTASVFSDLRWKQGIRAKIDRTTLWCVPCFRERELVC